LIYYISLVGTCLTRAAPKRPAAALVFLDLWAYPLSTGGNDNKGRESLGFNQSNYKSMVRGNFIGAAIVAIIYTVYILINPLPTKWQTAVTLVVLNALTIVLMSFAFKK
jgi:hypothetical protein